MDGRQAPSQLRGLVVFDLEVFAPRRFFTLSLLVPVSMTKAAVKAAVLEAVRRYALTGADQLRLDVGCEPGSGVDLGMLLAAFPVGLESELARQGLFLLEPVRRSGVVMLRADVSVVATDVAQPARVDVDAGLAPVRQRRLVRTGMGWLRRCLVDPRPPAGGQPLPVVLAPPAVAGTAVEPAGSAGAHGTVGVADRLRRARRTTGRYLGRSQEDPPFSWDTGDDFAELPVSSSGLSRD